MKKGTAVTIQLLLARSSVVIGLAHFTRGSIACGIDFVTAGFCIGMAVATAKL